MKVAVLLAGEYREFPIAHKLMPFLKLPDVDCYVATWSESVTVHKNRKIPSITETITEEQVRSFVAVKQVDIATATPIPAGQTTSGKLVNRWLSAVSMMKNSGVKYDRVILTRLDLALEYNVDVFNRFLQQPFQDDELYGIFGGMLEASFPIRERGVMSDLFLVGTQASIERLLQLPLPVDADIHRYLGQSCAILYRDFKNVPIPKQCVVRSNCRGMTNPTFSEVKWKAKEWWETRYLKFFSMGDNIFEYTPSDPLHVPTVVSNPRPVRQMNLNSINLWDKQDYVQWAESYTAERWHNPDTEERFNQQRALPENSQHVTYEVTEIQYIYNSMGYRAPTTGPLEFYEGEEYLKLMVGGCSLTEGIGMAEYHLWFNQLIDIWANNSLLPRPMATCNVGKGGISTETALRNAYVAIQHDNIKPDLVYFLLPRLARKEVLLLNDNNMPMVHHFLPSTIPTKTSPRSVVETYELLTRHVNYRQIYHDTFRNLLFMKWFLESKQIPWFFSFWGNDFYSKQILEFTNGGDKLDCSIPTELEDHHIPVYIKQESLLTNKPFKQTIGRDFMHPGPNSHLDLAEQMMKGLSYNKNFNKLLTMWDKND